LVSDHGLMKFPQAQPSNVTRQDASPLVHVRPPDLPARQRRYVSVAA
jgi:hypothetical protein